MTAITSQTEKTWDFAIQFLDLDRVQRFVKMNDDEFAKKDLRTITERIVGEYNKILNSLADENAKGKEVSKKQKNRKAKKINKQANQWEKKSDYFTLESYQGILYRRRPISMLHDPKAVKDTEKEKDNEPDRRTDDLYFLFRTIVLQQKDEQEGKEEKNIREIVGLTTRNGWNVLRACVDYNYPIKVAERILDPKRIDKITRYSVVGSYATKEELLQPGPHIICTISSLYHVIESFECWIKGNASLYTLRAFCDNSKVPAPEPRRMIIRTGLVRFSKPIDFNSYAPLCDLLSKYRRGIPTNTVKITIDGEEKKEEPEKRDPLFSFLSLLSPITREGDNKQTEKLNTEREEAKDIQVVFKDIDKLNQKLVRQVFSVFKRNAVHFRHKHLREYLEAHSFQIIINQTPFLFVSPPSINEVVEAVLTAQGETFEQLSEIEKRRQFFNAFQKGQLIFGRGAKETVAKLMDCLEGEASLGKDEKRRIYYRVRGMWYQLSADFHALLAQAFRSLLKEALIPSGEEGALPLKWHWAKQKTDLQSSPINRDILKEILGSATAPHQLMTTLQKEDQASYVDAKGNITHTKLLGEILNVEKISANKKNIEKILSDNRDKKLTENLLESLGTDAAQIKEELEKKRKILEDRGIDGHSFLCVSNPLITSRIKAVKIDGKKFNEEQMDKLRKFLEKSSMQNFSQEAATGKGETEEQYNRKYLYTHSHTGGQPYGKSEGYLVLDRVLSLGVELCDIIRYTPTTAYLYQVKSEFGQHTRDACSQILNAAKELRSSLSSAQNSFLVELWDSMMKRKLSKSSSRKVDTKEDQVFTKALKMQGEHLGEQGFFDIFKRKIVFVYACLDTRKLAKEPQVSTTILSDMFGEFTQENSRKIHAALKLQGFLDEEDRLTAEFYRSTSESFKLDNISERDYKKIYACLKDKASKLKSTIAKLELLRLSHELAKLGFALKICEIESTVVKDANQKIDLPPADPVDSDSSDEEDFNSDSKSNQSTSSSRTTSKQTQEERLKKEFEELYAKLTTQHNTLADHEKQLAEKIQKLAGQRFNAYFSFSKDFNDYMLERANFMKSLTSLNQKFEQLKSHLPSLIKEVQELNRDFANLTAAVQKSKTDILKADTEITKMDNAKGEKKAKDALAKFNLQKSTAEKAQLQAEARIKRKDVLEKQWMLSGDVDANKYTKEWEDKVAKLKIEKENFEKLHVDLEAIAKKCLSAWEADVKPPRQLALAECDALAKMEAKARGEKLKEGLPKTKEYRDMIQSCRWLSQKLKTDAEHQQLEQKVQKLLSNQTSKKIDMLPNLGNTCWLGSTLQAVSVFEGRIREGSPIPWLPSDKENDWANRVLFKDCLIRLFDAQSVSQEEITVALTTLLSIPGIDSDYDAEVGAQHDNRNFLRHAIYSFGAGIRMFNTPISKANGERYRPINDQELVEPYLVIRPLFEERATKIDSLIERALLGFQEQREWTKRDGTVSRFSANEPCDVYFSFTGVDGTSPPSILVLQIERMHYPKEDVKDEKTEKKKLEESQAVSSLQALFTEFLNSKNDAISKVLAPVTGLTTFPPDNVVRAVHALMPWNQSACQTTSKNQSNAQKIQTLILFPTSNKQKESEEGLVSNLRIDLGRFIRSNPYPVPSPLPNILYRVESFIVHRGNTFGHWVTYRRDGNKWKYCDDLESDVKEVKDDVKLWNELEKCSQLFLSLE